MSLSNARSDDKEDGITRKLQCLIHFVHDIHSVTPAYFTFWKDGLEERKS